MDVLYLIQIRDTVINISCSCYDSQNDSMVCIKSLMNQVIGSFGFARAFHMTSFRVRSADLFVAVGGAPIPKLTDRKKSRKLESKGAHAMEEKKMKKRTAPPRYDDAFKAGAVRLVTEQGRQPVEVAKELGICIDTLRSWLKASGVQMGQVSKQNREQKRIRELEAENRSLRKQLGEKDEVIDVLKKSVGILSKP